MLRLRTLLEQAEALVLEQSGDAEPDKALETGKGALEVETWPRVLLPSFLHPQPTSMQPFECKCSHPSNGIVYCPTLMSEDFVRCFHVKPLN